MGAISSPPGIPRRCQEVKRPSPTTRVLVDRIRRIYNTTQCAPPVPVSPPTETGARVVEARRIGVCMYHLFGTLVPWGSCGSARLCMCVMRELRNMVTMRMMIRLPGPKDSPQGWPAERDDGHPWVWNTTRSLAHKWLLPWLIMSECIRETRQAPS